MSRGPRILHTTMGPLGTYRLVLEPYSVKTLQRVARLAGLDARHEISLVLCDNPTIRRINRRWRAKDKPTDVLSFPLYPLAPGTPPPEGALGDIIISLPTLRAAARLENIPTEQHLTHLLVHGLLHLLGFDHRTDAEEKIMKRCEKRLMAGEVLHP